MEMSRPLKILRDITAVFVTALFMFPIFWWALTSIKPISAVFDKDRVNFFDFTPTFINYGVTLFGQSRSQIAIDEGLGMGVAGAEAYDSRMSILESIIVSIGATAMKMMPNTSVMMPRTDGAIMMAMVTSAALRRSFRCISTS